MINQNLRDPQGIEIGFQELIDTFGELMFDVGNFDKIDDEEDSLEYPLEDYMAVRHCYGGDTKEFDDKIKSTFKSEDLLDYLPKSINL